MGQSLIYPGNRMCLSGSRSSLDLCGRRGRNFRPDQPRLSDPLCEGTYSLCLGRHSLVSSSSMSLKPASACPRHADAPLLYSILWVAVFGVFGKMYLNEDPEGNPGIQRMKNAVWVDLTNVILWFITACLGAILFFRSRGKKTLHTGRATIA